MTYYTPGLAVHRHANGATPAKAPRLASIDGVRGYLLLMMYLAHFSFIYNSPLFWLHHGRYSAVWDGEFFVLLSGFVCALAYRRSFIDGGLIGCWRSVVPRVGWLLVYQTVTIAITAAIFWSTKPTRIYPETVMAAGISPGDFFYRSLTLVDVLPFVSVLPLYMILMLFIPIALALLTNGRIKTFFAVLVVLWCCALVEFDKLIAGEVRRRLFDWTDYFSLTGYFNPVSWALVFYVGFYLGFRYKRDGAERFVSEIVPVRADLFGLAMAFNILMLVTSIVNSQFFKLPGWVTNDYRAEISLLGLANTASLAYTIYYLLVRARSSTGAFPVIGRMLNRLALSGPLQLAGRNSLFVYAAHVPLIFAISYLLVVSGAAGSGVMVMIAVVAGAAVLLATARFKRRFLPNLP